MATGVDDGETATPTLELFVRQQPEPEIVDNKLSRDYVYSQKFDFALSEAHLFKESVAAYVNKMLNGLNCFFKSQLYYKENNDDSETVVGCVVNFHLFCLECLSGEHDGKKKISEHVQEFLNDFQTVQLTSTELLLRNQTTLRKPIYRYVYNSTHTAQY